jgi:hypothetical protein
LLTLPRLKLSHLPVGVPQLVLSLPHLLFRFFRLRTILSELLDGLVQPLPVTVPLLFKIADAILKLVPVPIPVLLLKLIAVLLWCRCFSRQGG